MTLKQAYDHESSAAATLDIIDLGTVSKEPLLRRWLLPIGQDQTPVTRMTRYDHGKTVEAFRSTESISQLPETRLPTRLRECAWGPESTSTWGGFGRE
jgi:hypothetical protein